MWYHVHVDLTNKHHARKSRKISGESSSIGSVMRKWTTVMVSDSPKKPKNRGRAKTKKTNATTNKTNAITSTVTNDTVNNDTVTNDTVPNDTLTNDTSSDNRALIESISEESSLDLRAR